MTQPVSPRLLTHVLTRKQWPSRLNHKRTLGRTSPVHKTRRMTPSEGTFHNNATRDACSAQERRVACDASSASSTSRRTASRPRTRHHSRIGLIFSHGATARVSKRIPSPISAFQLDGFSPSGAVCRYLLYWDDCFLSGQADTPAIEEGKVGAVGRRREGGKQREGREGRRAEGEREWEKGAEGEEA